MYNFPIHLPTYRFIHFICINIVVQLNIVKKPKNRYAGIHQTDFMDVEVGWGSDKKK